MTPKRLAIAGLVLNLIGAFCLAFFPAAPQPHWLEFESSPAIVETFSDLREWLWWTGPAFLFGGFGLQLWAIIRLDGSRGG